MKKKLRILKTAFLVLVPLLIVGCAAPGSALTRPGIRGRLVDARGHGLSNRRVDLMLPPEYGLAGLDAAWGKPEDYGHRMQVATVQTDSSGRFSYLFPPTTYSIAFFLVPPLGVIPREPPKPVFALRTAAIQPDSYLIGPNHDRLDYRILVHGTNALRPDSAPRITGSFSLEEIPASANSPHKLKGWEADITVTQP